MLYKVIWKGPRAAMEAAATLFTEAYHSTAHAVGLQKLEDGADHWSAEVYFEEPPDVAQLELAIAAFDRGWSGVAPGAVEEVPDKDWVAHSLEGLGIVRAGRFVLYGVHDAENIPQNNQLIPIRIDANQAFGTGHHPTTARCLELLDRFAGFAPKSVLDLGCGSGVLAIAAAKIWDRRIIASDIDADAVAIANENAELNGVADKVNIFRADGFDHARIAARAPFDFVFANILAGPLTDLAPQMAGYMAANGRAMLAGLMVAQEPGVTAAYEAAGFRLLNRLDHEVWPVLLFVKAA